MIGQFPVNIVWLCYFNVVLKGGALTSSRGGWRSAMGLIAGLCFIFLITGLIAIPKESDEKSSIEWVTHFDWIGSALSATGLALLTFAVSCVCLHKPFDADSVLLTSFDWQVTHLPLPMGGERRIS